MLLRGDGSATTRARGFPAQSRREYHRDLAAARLRRRLAASRQRVAVLRRQLATQRHAARHDPLTGLYNRRAFYDELCPDALSDPGRLPATLVYIDLDDFKGINDTYGHTTGDLVLATVGKRLRDWATAGHAARVGGDEFAVLLPTPDSAATPDIGRLAGLLSTPIHTDRHVLTVGASIGIAVATTAGASLYALLAEADAAMYRAKHQAHQHKPAHSPTHTATTAAADGRAPPTPASPRRHTVPEHNIHHPPANAAPANGAPASPAPASSTMDSSLASMPQAPSSKLNP